MQGDSQLHLAEPIPLIKLPESEAVLLLNLSTAYNLATNFGHNRESGFSCQIVLDY